MTREQKVIRKLIKNSVNIALALREKPIFHIQQMPLSATNGLNMRLSLNVWCKNNRNNTTWPISDFNDCYSINVFLSWHQTLCRHRDSTYTGICSACSIRLSFSCRHDYLWNFYPLCYNVYVSVNATCMHCHTLLWTCSLIRPMFRNSFQLSQCNVMQFCLQGGWSLKYVSLM